MSISRRDLLRYGTVAGVATVAVPMLGTGTASAATRPATKPMTDAQSIVAAYRELQIGRNRRSPERDKAVAALDQVATTYDSSMNVGSGQLWPDLPTGPGSDYFPTMFYRLRTIAVDWATPGSALSIRDGMAERLVTALDTLYRTEYNENTAEIGNWYSYEIGVPYWLLQIIVSLGDTLSQDQIAKYLRPILKFVNDPNVQTSKPTIIETGANRADKSLITVVTGALLNDPARIATGVDCVTDVAGGGANSLINRVTSGDGYHTDGSFIQHGVVPYPGHYGLVLLTAIAGLIQVTAGTAKQLSPEVKNFFYRTVSDVYGPFVVGGAMMEPVRGRMLSREGETGYDAGHQLTAAVVLLARSAPRPYADQLAGLAAKWIDQGRWAPYLEVSDLARFSGGLQMVGVPEVEYAQELLATRPRRPPTVAVHRSFPQTDRMVHAMPGWSASLGLSSTRICRYESINGQNLHGWYVGDGALYTFLPTDQGHYSDAYWPTVDATAIPGTTESTGTPPPLGAEPTTSGTWTGGVRWDDGHGGYGLDFTSQDGTVTAKKSWFFTPDAVICLGAAITGSSSVRTTIENRNLGENGTNRLLVDGLPGPTTANLAHARWLHLEGTGGYVLLEPAPVTLLREDRTGTWYGIDTGANTHGTTVPYTRRFQKILLDHGVRPSGATYAYAVLPGATPWRTATMVGRCRVLANTAQAQAVAVPGDMTAANFFAAGSVGGITVSGPAAVGWGRVCGGWSFALADPTQTQDTIRVTARGIGGRITAHDPAVTVVSTGPSLVVDIKVGGSFGATHRFTTR